MTAAPLFIEAKPWTSPLRAPFKIAQRTAFDAKSVLVSVGGGSEVGYGSASPAGYVTGESIDSIVAAVTSNRQSFEGFDLSRIGPLLDRASELFPDAPSARAAVEMGLLDLWAKHHRIHLWHYFGARKTSVITDLTIPIVGPKEARKIAQQATAEGFTHFKIKVGGPDGHDSDIARIKAVVAVAPQAGLRVDANQGFEPDAAIRLASELVEITPNVELLEQPVSKDDVAGLKYVRDHVSIPVFADEAAQNPASVRLLIREQAVDGVNIKLMKSGISGALEIISICRSADIKLMIGCMLEPRLSLTAAAYIAAGTGAISFVDLDSHLLLCADPGRTGGFDESGPLLSVNTSGYGWGVNGTDGVR